MEKIMTINGIEYIQKSEYDKAQKDLDNIKQLVSSSIADLNNFLNPQTIKKSVKTTEKENKKETVKGYTKRSHFKLRKAGQKLYHLKMDKNGDLYDKRSGRVLHFTIRDVITINKRYDSKTNRKVIEEFANEFGVVIDVIHRILFNLDEGTFAPFIKQYLSSMNDIKITQRAISYENNPEKRKELGIS